MENNQPFFVGDVQVKLTSTFPGVPFCFFSIKPLSTEQALQKGKCLKNYLEAEGFLPDPPTQQEEYTTE